MKYFIHDSKTVVLLLLFALRKYAVMSTANLFFVLLLFCSCYPEISLYNRCINASLQWVYNGLCTIVEHTVSFEVVKVGGIVPYDLGKAILYFFPYWFTVLFCIYLHMYVMLGFVRDVDFLFNGSSC